MKLKALMIAVALVAGTTAFAQAPNGTATAPASTSANSSMSASGDMKSEQAPVKKMHKKVAKRRHHAAQHAMARMHRHHMMASARHHRHHLMASARHHQLMASAHRRHHLMARARMEERTRAMGAGPASPSVALNSPARERRMDSAYNDWLRTQGRR
jgi:hypothetical protein